MTEKNGLEVVLATQSSAGNKQPMFRDEDPAPA